MLLVVALLVVAAHFLMGSNEGRNGVLSCCFTGAVAGTRLGDIRGRRAGARVFGAVPGGGLSCSAALADESAAVPRSRGGRDVSGASGGGVGDIGAVGGGAGFGGGGIASGVIGNGVIGSGATGSATR